MTDVCLNLLGSPELEEKLLDQLLMHPKISIFVSQAAASHGEANSATLMMVSLFIINVAELAANCSVNNFPTCC